jgi:hypothetical protein
MISLARIMGKLVNRFDFWSIRDPSQFDTQGLPRPGDSLKGLKGYRQLGELSAIDPTISNAVRMVRNMLFDYRHRDQPQFTVECSHPELSSLIRREFLDKRGDEDKFGYGVYGLENFLRSMAAQTMVYGRNYIKIKWEHDNKPDKHWHVKRFIRMFPGDIKLIHPRNTPVTFQWRHREEMSNPRSPIVEERLASEDVIATTWIFDGTEKLGESPIKRVTRYYWECVRYYTVTLAYMYSWANPDDKRFWVERARYIDLKKALENHRKRQLLMTKELGVPEMYPTPSMTEFYEIYYFLKFRRRLVEIRKYVLNQFNEQVIRRFALKNGYDDEARIAEVGYLSISEIDSLLTRFTAREITKDEVLKSFN